MGSIAENQQIRYISVVRFFISPFHDFMDISRILFWDNRHLLQFNNGYRGSIPGPGVYYFSNRKEIFFSTVPIEFESCE